MDMSIIFIERIVSVCLTVAVLTAISVKDRKTRKIPDRLVLFLVLSGLFSVPFFPEIGMAERMTGALGVSLLLVAISLIAPGSFGGGDIKLMAASGFVLGWEKNWEAFAIGVMLCGMYCVTGMLIRAVKGVRIKIEDESAERREGIKDGSLREGLGRKSQIALGPFLCMGVMTMQISTVMELFRF